MTAYYNEFDPFAAAWLRELIKAGHIAPGDVDERSIVEVKADDLKGYTQCHFFAGIGGWSIALRYAMWPDNRPVWTGSAPCQPYSSMGKNTRQQDERHLWPDWYRLISQCQPAEIFGEQVDDAIAAGWADEVLLNLEAQDYACAAAVLPAYSVTANHERNRLFFFANSAQKPRIHQPISREREARLHHHNNYGPSRSWDEAESKVYSIHDGLPSFVGEFEGFGNAIHAGVAAEFIKAVMI